MLFGKKENKWYYRAQKAYRQEKLPAPYASLFDYYCYIEDKTRVHGGNGHRDFFSLAKLDGHLDIRVKDLRSVLPDGLLENFNAAYEKFVSLGDDPEYEAVKNAFDELDYYAFEHFGKIKEILKGYVTEMMDKHYL